MTAAKPIKIQDWVLFIAVLLLLRTTNQRSKWNKTLDQGGSRTEGVLVQAQSVARYLDGQGGVRNRTAVAADSHGNHSRAVDGLVCAVRGKLHAGAQCAGAAGGLPRALDLEVRVGDRPGTVSGLYRGPQAERLLGADEGSGVVRCGDAVGRDFAIGGCDFPLAAPGFGYSEVTHLEANASRVATGVGCGDGSGAERSADGNNERCAVAVGGDVRSSIVASRFAGKTQDLKTIAGEAGVDIVLTGTLLRAGEQLRVSTQLVEAPGGTLVWSQTSQLSLGDIFKLQDDVTSRIVESLSLPLTTREHRMLKHDVPASAKAYEFYLRANQLVGNGAWSLARDLYLECLQEDPRYAPAWARLGRVYHFLGKFGDTNSDENLKRAEAAIVRALEINPELSMAHNLHARLEIDFGRAQDVMTRLLKRAQARAADPELFAGLVHACRYCGLLDASRAADEQARRIDKLISTSVVHTYFMLGDYQQAHEMFADDPITDALTLMMLGRDQEVVEKLQKAEDMEAVGRRWCDALRLLVEGHRAQGLAAAQTILPPGYRDPETLYYVARLLAHFGDPGTALALLARAVEEGFFCFSALARDPWLNTLRGDPAFTKILRHAEARHREALAAFLQADGDRLLGLKLSR